MKLAYVARDFNLEQNGAVWVEQPVMAKSGTRPRVAFRMLRARAVGYGVADRIDFIRQIPYDSLGEYLSAIHICYSTQTNDVPGNVRTTGKLPLYLVAGRYILASDVGESARVLPASKLENYQGTVDRAYPGRLAKRIRTLERDRPSLDATAAMTRIARNEFDDDVLAPRLAGLIGCMLSARAPHRGDAAVSSNTPEVQ